MRYIDMQTWSRRNHFRVFNTFNHPHFNMCVNLDVTAFYPFVKHKGYSLTISMVYIIARASNAIPEFRQRIRGDQVVEHEIVNPGFSILIDKDLFSFCPVEYAEDFSGFAQRAAKSISYVKAHPDLENNPEKDDVLYMSPIPWVSFTSFSHPAFGFAFRFQIILTESWISEKTLVAPISRVAKPTIAVKWVFPLSDALRIISWIWAAAAGPIKFFACR